GRYSGKARNLPAGGERARVLECGCPSPESRRRTRRALRGVSQARDAERRLARAAAGRGLVSGVVRPGRTIAHRAQRPAGALRATISPRRLARTHLRGGKGRAFLPLDAGADPVLRGVRRLGALEQASSAGRQNGPLQLARSLVVVARTHDQGAVRTDCNAIESGTAWPGRSPRLDRGGAQPRGPGVLLQKLPGRPGRAVLLRAVPRSIRPGAPERVGRVVHPARDRALHGGASGQRAARRAGTG